MSEPYVDPGHRIPDAGWANIVRRAQELRGEHEQNKSGGASPIAAPVLDMRGRSNKHSGVSGIATQLLVLHSAECPLRGGYAQSLTEWAITSTVVASWHRFVDPIARVYMMDDSVAAWHASEANPMSIGWEQAGYARFTREQWMTPDGLLQLNSLAYDMAQVALRDGIPPFWLTTDQVTAITTFGDRSTKGFCLHRQIDPETRTDPGDAYPYELLMTTIRQFMGATTQSTTNPEEDDMGHVDSISDEAANKIADHLLSRDYTTDEGKPGKFLWVLRSLHGILKEQASRTAEAVVNQGVPWYGFNGQQPVEGRRTTSLAVAAGFEDSLHAHTARELATVKELLNQLALAQGVIIDYDQVAAKVAEAVVDEQARRLSQEAAK